MAKRAKNHGGAGGGFKQKKRKRDRRASSGSADSVRRFHRDLYDDVHVEERKSTPSLPATQARPIVTPESLQFGSNVPSMVSQNDAVASHAGDRLSEKQVTQCIRILAEFPAHNILHQSSRDMLCRHGRVLLEGPEHGHQMVEQFLERLRMDSVCPEVRKDLLESIEVARGRRAAADLGAKTLHKGLLLDFLTAYITNLRQDLRQNLPDDLPTTLTAFLDGNLPAHPRG